MDFRDQFRKMSDDVGKMAREVADTSKKATARARVRRMINSCNESLQTIYQEIGSRYYVENQCQPEEQYEGLFQQASDLIAQIDVLKSELAGLDNASICPECGSKVNDGRSSVRSAEPIRHSLFARNVAIRLRRDRNSARNAEQAFCKSVVELQFSMADFEQR